MGVRQSQTLLPPSAGSLRWPQVASVVTAASPIVFAALALFGASISAIALIGVTVLGSLLILTDESLETKPHMVVFQ